MQAEKNLIHKISPYTDIKAKDEVSQKDSFVKRWQDYNRRL